MPKVTVLNCPGCGAPLPTESARCDFCRARVEISDDRTKVVLAGIACPKCRWDNAPTRLFCGKCGANLMQKCHNCGEPNPIGSSYCGGCGMELSEARRLTVEKLTQEAKHNGLNGPPYLALAHEQYIRLFEQLARPDETAILFIGDMYYWATPPKRESEAAEAVVFVATDQSLMFLRRERRGLLLRRREAISVRVSFGQIESLSVDVPKQHLVISLEDGEARVDLRPQTREGQPTIEFDRCRAAARELVHYFKPFLPLRLQQGW